MQKEFSNSNIKHCRNRFTGVLSKTQLASGDDGATVVIGDYTTALSDVLYSEDFQYLLVPSITTDSELLTLTDALVLREANEGKICSIN